MACKQSMRVKKSMDYLLYYSHCTKRKKVNLHLPNDVFPMTLGNGGVMAQQEKARADGRFAC
jgi:hypothetical protein